MLELNLSHPNIFVLGFKISSKKTLFKPFVKMRVPSLKTKTSAALALARESDKNKRFLSERQKQKKNFFFFLKSKGTRIWC